MIANRVIHLAMLFTVGISYSLLFSINKLAAYLRTLNFTYPYHQAIGFYLERAGDYSDSQINLIRQFPIEFDFYLTYQMKNPDYNERWRLFIPKGFQ
mgnify:CR=1 FL=1